MPTTTTTELLLALKEKHSVTHDHETKLESCHVARLVSSYLGLPSSRTSGACRRPARYPTCAQTNGPVGHV